MNDTRYRPVQQVALIAMRTVIGWHFLYEAYYKIWSPAWSPAGTPLARWTSAGYLKGASGPLAGLFQRMVNAGWTPWIDRTVKVCLLLYRPFADSGAVHQDRRLGRALFPESFLFALRAAHGRSATRQ